jgi:hypothetical protein
VEAEKLMLQQFVLREIKRIMVAAEQSFERKKNHSDRKGLVERTRLKASSEFGIEITRTDIAQCRNKAGPGELNLG